MVDAYDVLNLPLDASPEDIKKAYRRLSLQLHPDKVKANSTPLRRDGATPEDQFNKLKAAYDVLQDSSRRSVYDAFGVDLGSTPPAQEVWSIGIHTLIVPVSSFTMKTFIAYVARWIATFFAVKLMLLLCAVSGGLLYSKGIAGLGSFKVVKPMQALINIGAMCGLLVLHCLWPALFDAACFLYLVSEVIGVEVLAASGQLVGFVAFGCLVVAWLFSRWWTWLLYLELGLLALAVLSSGVAALVLHTFIEEAKMKHGDHVKTTRQSLRKGRKDLLDQVERLTKRVEAQRANKPR